MNPLLHGGFAMVDLTEDQRQVKEKWRRLDTPHVALSLAAALTFHRIHRDKDVLVPRPEYDTVLNLIAAGLSRLLRIYMLDERAVPVPVDVPLGAGKFRDGARRFERNSGHSVGPLVVRRDELAGAIQVVKESHIAFPFSEAVKRSVSQEHKQA
jgi:hypothetical protein